MGAPESSLQGRRVLVTGASGFIGSHLCRRLAATGAQVHGLSRTPHPGPWTAHQGDLTRAETASELLASIRPEVVFHLAALVTGSRDPAVLEPVFQHNLVATAHLLHAAVGKPCRVVLAGSLEEPEPGDAGAAPCSPYAASKWAASGYARMLHALYGLDVVTARVFMAYGPAQRDEQKLVPYVIQSLLGGEMPKLSSGRREVDWIYIDDVVEGLAAIASAEGLSGCSVDLGSGALTPIRRVVEKLFELTGAPAAPEFGTLPDRPLERVAAADIARSKSLSGWSPQVPLDEGLARTVAWYAGRAALR